MPGRDDDGARRHRVRACLQRYRPAVIGEPPDAHAGPDFRGGGRQRGEGRVGHDHARSRLEQGRTLRADRREPLGRRRGRQELTRRACRQHRVVHLAQPGPERELRGGDQDAVPRVSFQPAPELAGLARGGHVERIRIAEPEDPAAALGARALMADLGLLEHDDVPAARREGAGRS